jgi:Ni/Fe-hydrogenase 1 B-type cytochrome subunit
MAVTTIKRVKVWSGLLRLSHWLMAFAVPVLLATGWLLGSLPQAYDALLDYHYLAGYVLIAGVALRVWLLFFGRATDTLADLLPRRQQAGAVLDMLRFYLSFGRWRLPAWYAHNPLWQPLYLLLLTLLVAQILTGVFADAPYLLASRTVGEWHASGAIIIAGIAGLHVLAVFMHDLKGTGSDTSAMINGHRIFVINPLQQPVEPGVQRISPEQIDRPGSKPGDR